MFEDSTEGFIARWRRDAADVEVFSRVEGTPLIECEVGGSILQMLERTGPYLAPPGAARAIVNPTVDTLQMADGEARSIESTGVGKARITATVVRRDDPFLVVDAGAPLVVSVEGELPEEIVPGSSVSFEPVPPIHFFVLSEARAPVSSSADSDAP